MAWDKNRPYAPFWNRTDYYPQDFGSMDSYGNGAEVTVEMIDAMYTYGVYEGPWTKRWNRKTEQWEECPPSYVWLCMQAFDGGATYGSESTRYGVNARAYDWEHWLAKHESLFVPKPTDTWERIIEDAIREGFDRTDVRTQTETNTGLEDFVARCKALAGEVDE